MPDFGSVNAGTIFVTVKLEELQQFQQGLRQIEDRTRETAQKAGSALEELGDAFRTLVSVVGATVSAATVLRQAWSGMQSAMREETALARVRIQLQEIGVNSETTVKQVQALAKAFQSVAGVQEEKVFSVFQRLLGVTNNYNEALNLTNTLMRLQIKYGEDITSQIIGAIGTGVLGRLPRTLAQMGIPMEDINTVDEMLRRLTERAENLTEVLELQETQMRRTREQWQEFVEQISSTFVPIFLDGMKLITTAVAGAITAIAGLINALLTIPNAAIALARALAGIDWKAIFAGAVTGIYTGYWEPLKAKLRQAKEEMLKELIDWGEYEQRVLEKIGKPLRELWDALWGEEMKLPTPEMPTGRYERPETGGKSAPESKRKKTVEDFLLTPESYRKYMRMIEEEMRELDSKWLEQNRMKMSALQSFADLLAETMVNLPSKGLDAWRNFLDNLSAMLRRIVAELISAWLYARLLSLFGLGTMPSGAPAPGAVPAGAMSIPRLGGGGITVKIQGTPGSGVMMSVWRGASLQVRRQIAKEMLLVGAETASVTL